MDKIRSAEDLVVFKKIHALVLSVYTLTEKFPSEEKFGLTYQIRRSAVSIPSNILEGANRLSSKEYRQFVGIAKGSAAELKYQLLLSRDLGYISDDIYQQMNNEMLDIIRMLFGLAKSLGKSAKEK